MRTNLTFLAGTAEYNGNLRIENENNRTDEKWKEDHSECSRRIWNWWGGRKQHFIITKSSKVARFMARRGNDPFRFVSPLIYFGTLGIYFECLYHCISRGITGLLWPSIKID